MRNWFKKVIYKFTFAKWETYILKKEVIDIFIKKPKFNLIDIKDYIFAKIEVDDDDFIIAADPFFYNQNTILFESISKSTGFGQIFKYDISKNRKFIIPLPENKHFSFPRSINLGKNSFLSCESSESKGLCLFETNNDLSIIKKASISINSEDLNYHIIDPILLLSEETILLYCTSSEYGDNTLLVFHSKTNKPFEFKLYKIIKLHDGVNKSSKLRLAGTIRLKDKLNICTQNEETSYGSSLNVIDSDFKSNLKSNFLYQSNIKFILSCKNMIGPHTINALDNMSMIAIDIAKPAWKYLPIKIKHYLKMKKLF